MSGGIVRKVQPFTIGTKLSVPAEHKYQDQVVEVHLPKPPLNSCELQNNCEDRGSAVPDCPEGPQVLYDDEAEEDGNPTSPAVSSRSIKKIAICRNTEEGPTAPSRGLDPGILVRSTPEVTSVHPSAPAQEGKEEKRSSSYSKDGEAVDAEEEEEMETVTKTTSEHLMRWLLSNYQQDVKLALDVSSFYQQADSILSSINRKRGVSSGSAEQRSREMNDIANQITLLDQCVLRLSDLHPTLAARVTQKQAEVQDCWAILQAQSSAEQTDYSTGCCEEVEAGLGAALQESTTSTDKTLWWLNDSVSSQQEEVNQPGSMSKEEEVMSKTTVYNQDMKMSTLTLRINSLLSRCAELSMDVLDTETDMLVRCDPDRSDLEGLQEQQQKLEMDQQLVRQEVEELEQLTSDLQAVLAEEVEEVQSSLQAWEELGWSMADNRNALQQFQQLQAFLRSYLAMISWAEETRARIFSEVSMQKLRQAGSAELSELDRRIQHKFEDFDDLVELGRGLVKDRHHLVDIIKERTEELQSMLGWILVHWTAQKDQLGQRESDSTQVSLHHHKTVTHQHQSQLQPQSSESDKRLESIFPEHKQETAEDPEDSSDVRGENSNNPAVILRRGSCDETAKPASLVLEEPCAAVTPLGGSISLILTFDQQSEGNHGAAEHRLSPEPVHRVSTYLQVTDGNRESPGCKDLASDTKPATTLTSPSPPTSSTTATFLPKVSTVILPTLPTASSVSSLHLKPTARRRKRHTVTGLTGVDCIGREAAGFGGAAPRANTWPQEGKATGQIWPGSPVNTELQLYIKNSSVVPVAQEGTLGSFNGPKMQGDYSKSTTESSDQEKTHYSIPLGSTLSFHLPTTWDGISNFSSKGLTVERLPPEKTRDPLLSNPYGPPDHNEQASLSPDAIRKAFTVNPERGGSKEDPQDVLSESVSAPCPPEEAKSHRDPTEAVRMRNNREAEDELIVQEGISDARKQSSEADTCLPTEPENTHTKQSHHRHQCLSVHTKICDLKGHIYYSPKHTGLVAQQAEGLSNSLNPRVSRSGRVVVCSEDDCCICADGSTPRSIPGQETPDSRVSEKTTDPLRPERWQFEEVEDELEDIWNAVDRERAP